MKNKRKQSNKDTLFTLTEQQQNPGLADPKQFVVKGEFSFTGQSGDDAEEKASISSRNVKPYSPLGKRNRPGLKVPE
jgi:hypothetical protein